MKLFIGAVVILTALIGYVETTDSATYDRFWYQFATTDTLFAQQSVTTQAIRVAGCENVKLWWSGDGSDSVTVSAEGTIDGANWFAVALPAAAVLADWSAAYTMDDSLYASVPARLLRFTFLNACAESTSGGTKVVNPDTDTLTAVSVGVTCPNIW